MKVLVTGAAGFIGFYTSKSLMDQGHTVVGLDNLNDYYDINLKYARLKQLGIARSQAVVYKTLTKSSSQESLFSFIRLDIENREELPILFRQERFDLVINLAAQAGVRHSIAHPEPYVDTNIVGFLNVLECCRHHDIKRLIYASSSSVYGNSDQVPFSESQCIDKPVSLYGATKRANELMAHSYAHLFGMQTIGLRFFTVYGPWGRPDMAMFLFTKAVIEGKPIQVFNHGNLSRDFTYISDIVKGIIGVVQHEGFASNYEVFNIGNSEPVKLLDFIGHVEDALGIKAIKEMFPMQDGDVHKTYADTSKINQLTGYKPSTRADQGVKEFVSWYRDYYKV